MRLFFLFALLGAMQVTAKNSYGQGSVTLNLQNEPLEQALKEITSQTGYSFIYTRSQLKHTHNITIQVKNAALKDALDKCFTDQPLSYTIEDEYVIILDKPKINTPNLDSMLNIAGKVVGEDGKPLLRVTVTSIKSKKVTYTNEQGEFSLKEISKNDMVVFTCIGYEKKEISVNNTPFLFITMKQVSGLLDEAVITAYGKTTKRLNTGNIGKVSKEEIAQQPVSDPLSALHGKVPGLVVTQSSGMPGGTIKIQIRGQNSLAQGSEPLIIVDGVPLAANNQPINNLLSILSTDGTTGLSPIASINPLDIESIEILKDADATAIYGSRGANGVVLITTKKGEAGNTRVFANFYSGWSKVTSLPNMLNTSEYVRMRKEAIANDGFTPNTNPALPGYAPDILLWDTTRETNFAKMLLGNTARSYNGQVGFSGGSQNIQLFFSTGYNKEGTVFSESMGTDRISVSSNINYNSSNKKFTAKLASSYSNFKSNLIDASLPSFVSLPPNAPKLYAEDGNLNWEDGGYYFDNPVANFYRKYSSETDNLLSNLQADYKIFKGLSVRSSFGYNLMQVSEKSIVPIIAQTPLNNPRGSLNIAGNSLKSWIVEPQVEYGGALGNGRLNVLIGSTFSEYRQSSNSISADGYKSDNLLNSLSGAASYYGLNQFSEYKYTALFGRINYNWRQKYIVNVSGRSDGSSRFGPGKRFADFGAVGAAWLFDGEAFMRKLLPFLSFGKLRASYGLTGNDQIGNYKYLDTWSIYYNTYQDNTALYPTGLYNPLYGWETNKKLEVGLDLGFFKDRLYLSSTYYNNRSGNQLIRYQIPEQTGFVDVVRNFPALVQNQGFEFELITVPVKTSKFKWSFDANISLPSNKLLSFNDLASSAYAGAYIVGKSLNVIYKLHSLGVDPATGAFQFEDFNKDNAITTPSDLHVGGKTDPLFYGGFRNTLTFKRFELNIFFDFKKQTGLNYLYSIYGNYYIPGFPINQPKYVLERWENPGDVTEIQKFTTIVYSNAYRSKTNFRYSDGVYSDASFLRLKTASIAWQLPETVFKVIKTYNSKLFISAQNLFTISKYKGTDPEVQNYYALPTLRTIAAGINLNF